MIEEKILILEREDLIETSKETEVCNIKYSDFNGSIKKFHKNGIVLFIDEDGITRILKNRWGDYGTKWCIQILKN